MTVLVKKDGFVVVKQRDGDVCRDKLFVEVDGKFRKVCELTKIQSSIDVLFDKIELDVTEFTKQSGKPVLEEFVEGLKRDYNVDVFTDKNFHSIFKRDGDYIVSIKLGGVVNILRIPNYSVSFPGLDGFKTVIYVRGDSVFVETDDDAIYSSYFEKHLRPYIDD